MIKLKIDDTICDILENSQAIIADAINQAVSALPPNRIVTRLNINGNRYLGNSEHLSLNESVQSSHEIEIKTADKVIWAATGYDIALSSIERVQKSIIKSAELFREADKLNGNRLFVQCIEGLERFIEAITITKAALQLDFSKIEHQGISLAQIESNLNSILKSVFTLQEREDYQGLAEKIEYELLTNLSSWGETLKVLRNNQNSNA
jgi:hypothetical protein